MASLIGRFALLYLAATLFLWGISSLGWFSGSGIVGPMVSFACLLAAVFAAAYQYGLRTAVVPARQEVNRATFALFVTLLAIRAVLEMTLVGLAVAQSGVPILAIWAERWFEPGHYIQLAVTFGLALLAIRVVFPLAGWLGARRASRQVFS